MALLFHYTTSGGAHAIRSSKKLKKSVRQNFDAVYGDGVYFTSKSPWHHSKVDIVMNNWTVNRAQAEEAVRQGRVDYVVMLYRKMIKTMFTLIRFILN